MKFYRYTAVEYASKDLDGEYCAPPFHNPKLICHEYNLHKETQKGYWVGFGELKEGKLRSQSHWISKTSKKRFAYPTKEEALINLLKRTESRLKILQRQIDYSKAVLNRCQDEIPKK